MGRGLDLVLRLHHDGGLIHRTRHGLQQLLDSYLSHGVAPLSVWWCSPGEELVRGTRRCAGQGPRAQVASCRRPGSE